MSHSFTCGGREDQLDYLFTKIIINYDSISESIALMDGEIDKKNVLSIGLKFHAFERWVILAAVETSASATVHMPE